MASLKERYEELFGPTPAYDPIALTAPDDLLEQTQRRAIDLQGAAPTASPRRAIPEMPADPVEPQGAISGLLKTGASKTVAEPLVGAVEYGARQLGMEGVAQSLLETRADMASWRESVYARMNPEVMDMVGRELLTLDPDKTIWQGSPLDIGQAIAYKVIEQTPSLLATLVPGAVMMRAATVGKGITWLGASEAGISLGAIQNDIADGITQATTESLMEDSFRFRQLMDEYGDEAQARQQLIDEAQGLAPLIGGVAVGAISAAAGRYLAPVFEEKAGLALGQRIGRTAISEGFFQEGPQESVEQVAGNIAAAVYDGDREMLEGVAESYAQGALLGAIMGGGVGGILGHGGKEDLTPPELDQPDAPSAFRPGRGGPTGGQLDLGLEGGSGDARPTGIPKQQEMDFTVPDQLFDEKGNYLGTTVAQQKIAEEAEIAPGTVAPDVAAAIQANIKTDDKMEDLFLTPSQTPQQEAYNASMLGGQGLLPYDQQEMFPTAAPTQGPGVMVGPAAQKEMFPGPEQRRLGQPRMQMADQPMPEPQVDISAQMDQLGRGMRDGVYLAQDQNIDPAVLGDYPIIEDFDGRGGDMVFKDEETAKYWQEQLANSNPEDLQAILGEITGAGTGKPIDGRLAVQKINENGGVEQESLVSTPEEARALQEEWGGETRVLTSEEAIARREQMAVRDLFDEQPKVEGTTGETPRGITGRARVRFTDDAGNIIEDRTFSDQRRANKYADQLADEYGLAQPDADARITVTPVRTLPKQQTKPTQAEQSAAIKEEANRGQTEGERVAQRIRKEQRLTPERQKLTEAVSPAKTRADAAKNLLRLAAEQMDTEKASSIEGMYRSDALEFKDDNLKADYDAAWQEMYANDFIIKNKDVIPLNVRGTVVAKAKRNLAKAKQKAEAARQAAAPRRRVEKVFREARRTDDAIVQQLGFNADVLAEMLDINRPSLTQAEENALEILKATRDVEETPGLQEGEEDEGFNAGEEDLMVNENTTPEDLKEFTDSEVKLALDDALRWRARYNKRLTPARIRAIKDKAVSRSLQEKEILRAVVSMRNQAESDSRMKGAKVVTNVQKNLKKGGYKATVRQTTSLTSVSEKYEEGDTKRQARDAKAKKLYGELTDNLKKALKRLQSVGFEVDEYGDLTETGQDELMGIWWAESMAELAQAVVELRRTDEGGLQLAESVNTALKRIANGSESLFAKEFAYAGRHTLSLNSKGLGRDVKRLTDKVEEHNAKVEAAVNARRNREKWRKNSDYKQFVAPIVKKFVESYYNGEGSYHPTLADAQNLAWALENFRAQGLENDFFVPIARMLSDFGFKFKKKKLVIATDEDGNFEFTPQDAHLMNRVRHGETINVEAYVQTVTNPAKPYEPVTIRKRRPEGEMDERISQREKRTDIKRGKAAEELQDMRHVRASQIFAAFRKVIDNKKSTIKKLIDTERRFLWDLKAEGFITQMGSEFVTIRFPYRWTATGGWQYQNITYRRSGKALSEQRITKGEARGRMSSIRKEYTKTKTRVSDRTEMGRDYTTKTLIGNVSTEFNAIAQEMETHGPEIRAAAGVMGDLLNDRTAPRDANAVVDAMLTELPESSFYGRILRKLRDFDMRNITVTYDWANELEGTVGKYFSDAQVVLISDKVLASTGNPEGNAVHAITHELLHAASVAKLRTDLTLRSYVDELRQQVIAHAKSRGVNWRGSYGLTNVDEFVAEAFSNETFQSALKRIKVDNESLWQKFTRFLRRVLNIGEAPEFDTIFDAVMAVEPQLFETAGAPLYSGEIFDATLAATANEVWGKINQTMEVERRARKAATITGSMIGRGKISHAFHSMRQLRERYQKYFGGENGPLARYMDAFNGRNARNNELMQLPEKMSRRWTELESKYGAEQALEFSRIATDSTIHMLDPSRLSTHEVNKKSAKAQSRLYNELRGRWMVLPQEYKALWNDVTQYYHDSLVEETNLMLLNAIRGVVTRGAGAMDVDLFDKNYSKDNIGKFVKQEDIINEFGDYLGDDAKETAALIQRLANVPAMKQGVYFPLMRYGEYAVYAKVTKPKKYFADNKQAYAYAAEQRASDPTLSANTRLESDGRWSVEISETEFVTAENVTLAEQERQRLIDEYGEANVGDVGRKLEMPRESTIGSNAALSRIIDSLEGNAAAQNAIKQFYLRNLSDQSFRKREIKRQNRRGVDYDLQHRNFANYAKQSSYHRAQLEYGWKMSKGMNDMATFLKNYRQEQAPPGLQGMTKEQLDNVYLTLKKRDEATTNPVELHKAIRGGIALTQFYMLTSASYHMINASQPWMVTLPTMGGKHGWGNALSAMKGAQGLIKSPIFGGIKTSGGGFKLLPWLKGADATAEKAFGVFDDLVEHLQQSDSRAEEHISMLEELRKTSVLEVSPLTELREIASGKTSYTSKVLDASRIMAHIVEVNNRVLTAIAAYDLEYASQKNNGAGEEAAREAATKYAEDMVSQTQFDYSTANKPPAFMKLPIVFQFMQWTQHIYAHLVRNTAKAFRGDKDAQKILAGVLATHTAAAGMLGMMLQPLKMAFGFAMMAFGDDDEPYTLKNALSGDTFDRVITSATNDLFGTTVSTALSRGLPATVGIDLSTRMSLGTMFFIDLRGDTPESVAGSLLSSFGGAGVNQMLTFGRGIQYFGSGDYMKGLEAFSPKFLRDILRAGRFTANGLVNSSGDTVLDTGDLNYYEVALQAIGFTPTDVGRFYEGQAAIKDKEAYVRDRKVGLLREFRTADAGGRAAVLERIAEFNRSFPQEAVTRSTILRNLKGKIERELQYERYGAAIDDKKAALYKGYGEPYR